MTLKNVLFRISKEDYTLYHRHLSNLRHQGLRDHNELLPLWVRLDVKSGFTEALLYAQFLASRYNVEVDGQELEDYLISKIPNFKVLVEEFIRQKLVARI